MEVNYVIGVATAATPLGPFKDIGRPLLTIGHGAANCKEGVPVDESI